MTGKKKPQLPKEPPIQTVEMGIQAEMAKRARERKKKTWAQRLFGG